MRASILTFIIIISEYSIITGGDGNCPIPPKVENAEEGGNGTDKFRMKCKDGFVRKAGTSNLFKCVDGKWKNEPPLVCIRNPLLPAPDVTTLIHTSRSPVTSSWSNLEMVTHYQTTQPGKSTSTVSGKTDFTTTHTASTTPWTSRQTSQRTTTMEETTETTPITPRITVSSTSDKESLTTVSSHSSSSLSSTSTGVPGQEAISSDATKGITAGAVILVIIAGLAATVAILFFRHRSRQRGGADHSAQMKTKDSGTDRPLIEYHTICPPDSIQHPETHFTVSPESTCTDATFSA